MRRSGSPPAPVARWVCSPLALLLRHADRLLEDRAGSTESIFPTPDDA